MVVIDRVGYKYLKKVCPSCNKPNIEDFWCKECNPKWLRQDFPNWTSGNELVDRFIQETQLHARSRLEILKWIPYDRLRNIKYLGFDTLYKANWMDKSKYLVVFKSLNN